MPPLTGGSHACESLRLFPGFVGSKGIFERNASVSFRRRTIALIVLFSQYMKKVNVPFPKYSRSKGFGVAWVAVFELFPV